MTNPNENEVWFCAVGDVLVDRDDPDSYFALCSTTIKEADVAFCQVETNYSERGAMQIGNRVPSRAHPKNAPAIKNAGFNIASFASNHCLDWGPDALRDTIDILKKLGLQVVGVGENIAEARKPAIIETKGTKIGFLAYNSILPYGYWAEDDKPGCAPIRALTLYEQRELEQPGTPATIHTYANAQDLAAVLDDIKKLRPKVDVLVLSLHFGLHFIPAEIANYQKQIAHTAIDAGTDLIIGHHAHILKGIEVYKGKTIFYSLGNFGFDEHLTKEEVESPRFREFMLLNPSWTIDPEYPTYFAPADSRKTVVAKVKIVNKKIEGVYFVPACINKKGQPGILHRDDKESQEVMDYMNWLCKEVNFDTKLTYEGDDVLVSAGSNI